MKKYESYKDSGIEWIGEIPQHWEVKKIKHLKEGSLIYGAQESAELDNPNFPRYIRITDMNDDGTLKNETFKSLPFEIAKDYLLNDKDILFARSGATVGKTFMYKKEYGIACFAGYLIRLRLNQEKVKPEYVNFCTQTNFYKNFIKETTIQATIQNVNAEKYGNFRIFLPKLKEQEEIVNYLNKKTSQIEAVIEKKKELIENLKEYRQSLITEVVTKGLNKDVEMKDSGIEWIGEIPKHWEMKKIKNKFKVQLGGTPNTNNDDFWEGNINWITPVDMSKKEEKYIGNSQRKLTEEGVLNSSATISEKGSIVLSCRAPVGLVKILSENSSTNQGCKTLIKKESSINEEFYYYFLLISKSELEKLSTGTTFIELSSENLKNFAITYPPKKEQAEIALYLNEKTQKIDNAIKQQENQISKLEEYRQSLISEVVTGKIKVDN